MSAEPLAHAAEDEEARQPHVVVFDVDGTLYRVNTLYDFLERLHAGRSSPDRLLFHSARTLPGKAFWLLATKVTGREVFRLLAYRSLRGLEVEEVAAACADYVRDVLPWHAIAEVRRMLDRHRDAGSHVMLISGSLQPLIEAIGREVGADACIAVEPEVERGVYTGRIARDVRGQKLDVLREHRPELHSFGVVTDNRDDLALVRAATEATVLTKAKHRDWWTAQGLGHVELLEV